MYALKHYDLKTVKNIEKNYYSGPLTRGDNVMVISGGYKDKIGKIIELDRKKSLVRVEGVNVKKVHKKSTTQLGVKEMFIHISNIMFYDDETKITTKLRWIKNGLTKIRYAVKLKKEI